MFNFETHATRLLRVSVASLLIAAATMVVGQQAATQTDAPEQVTTTADRSPRSVPANRPFSAIRYWHRVKVLPNGKTRFLRHERYPAHWARDAAGRVKVESIEFGEDCNRPTEVVPPECNAWGEDVFDPGAHNVTAWLEGPFAIDIVIIIPLPPNAVSELLEITSGLRTPDPEPDEEATSTKTDYLGEKNIGGVRATGVRTTFVYPAGHLGSKLPVTRIHEVWTSPELEMAVRVIDGDPKGEEIIRGLKKISLNPDPKLFQWPEEYSVQRPQHLLPGIKEEYVQHFSDFYAN
jgi:hypothetical protein